MLIARETALLAYRLLTRRWRKKRAAELTESGTWPGGVLFYHRVADSDMNDWSISARGFRRHMEWLQKNAKVVSLAKIQSTQAIGHRSELEVAITFDDGYFETACYAIPELIDRQWPCTYFVSNYFIESGLPFPHDAARKLPHPPNTKEQIEWMCSRGVEIGCHTYSHANLGVGLSNETLRREIIDARKQLQDLSGQAVDYFAFPYGMPQNMSHDAIDMVWEAGFKGFVSAYGDWNFVGDSPFHIRRIHGRVGVQSIANWLTLDPRKFRREYNVAYLPKGLRDASTLARQIDNDETPYFDNKKTLFLAK